ncbi:MAG: OmpH family outer membrane protein [Bacteroidales bacterium]|nr:OmpH family outer membrane protein [Bacteroidales bacterium]
MKKLIIILLALICTVGGFAQKAKFGHVDYGAIMKEMPGIDTAQTALLNVQKELQEAGQQMANEFKQKEAEYGQMANNGASAAVLKVKEDELTKLYARIQEFAAISEQELQVKQAELLKPFQDNLLAAIKSVAEAGNYAYVFDISTLAFYADSDDLTTAVKNKLGIK